MRQKTLIALTEFCRRHDLSRAFLYLLWRRGQGPRFLQVGARRIISKEAGADWRRSLEQTPKAAPSWTPLARPHKAGRTTIGGLLPAGRNRPNTHENARGGIPGRSQPYQDSSSHTTITATDATAQRAVQFALRRAAQIDRTADLLFALGKYVQAERWARRAQHRGKIKYSNVITFATKELRDRFSEAIIEAVRVANPDVLVPTEGRPA